MNRVPVRLLIVPTTLLALTTCAEVKDTLTRADARLHEMFGVAPDAAASGRRTTDRRTTDRRTTDRPVATATVGNATIGDAGHTPSADTLQAARLMNGDGVARDPEAAIALLRPHAEDGFPDAQFLLGLAHGSGQGVARDREAALSWFRRAAEQGHAQAQYLLGLAYQNGDGVARDPAWATRWFGKSAAQGVAHAQYMLGVAYATPAGVPRQIETAYYWLAIAERHGDERAAGYRDRIGALLPEATRTAVAARAERWQPTREHGVTMDDRPTLVFVQVRLAEAGFEPGPVDGLFGAKTREAIVRYRTARAIGAGAQIDRALLDALKAEGAAAG